MQEGTVLMYHTCMLFVGAAFGPDGLSAGPPVLSIFGYSTANLPNAVDSFSSFVFTYYKGTSFSVSTFEQQTNLTKLYFLFITISILSYSQLHQIPYLCNLY